MALTLMFVAKLRVIGNYMTQCCSVSNSHASYVSYMCVFLQVFGSGFLFASSYNPPSTSSSSSGWTGRQLQKRHVKRTDKLTFARRFCSRYDSSRMWLQAVDRARKKTAEMAADFATSPESVSSQFPFFFLLILASTRKSRKCQMLCHKSLGSLVVLVHTRISHRLFPEWVRLNQ